MELWYSEEELSTVDYLMESCLSSDHNNNEMVRYALLHVCSRSSYDMENVADKVMEILEEQNQTFSRDMLTMDQAITENYEEEQCHDCYYCSEQELYPQYYEQYYYTSNEFSNYQNPEDNFNTPCCCSDCTNAQLDSSSSHSSTSEFDEYDEECATPVNDPDSEAFWIITPQEEQQPQPLYYPSGEIYMNDRPRTPSSPIANNQFGTNQNDRQTILLTSIEDRPSQQSNNLPVFLSRIRHMGSSKILHSFKNSMKHPMLTGEQFLELRQKKWFKTPRKRNYKMFNKEPIE